MNWTARTFTQVNDWIRAVHSTNLTIVVGLVLANVFVYAVIIADIVHRPISEGTQNTLGLFITAMLGVGVTQFSVKRTTDDAYVKAKAGLDTTPRSPTPPDPQP